MTTRMPFDRFKGQFLAELPNEYLDWLITIELRRPLRGAVLDEYHRRCGECLQARGLRLALPATDAGLLTELVEASRRGLTRKYHPDTGGDPLVMTRINTLADGLLDQIAGVVQA
jgi:hypothetical protein